MKCLNEPNDKRSRFCASGESPPQPAIPPQLAEELAEILAEALAEDLLRGSDTESQRGEASTVTANSAITISRAEDERRTKWTTATQTRTPKKSTRADIPAAYTATPAAA
jgi:hypothetical protein